MSKECEHKRYRRQGRTLNGKQRYYCLDCGITSIHFQPKIGNNRISEDQEAKLAELLDAGYSQRQIKELTGLGNATISSRRKRDPAPPPISGPLPPTGFCDYCGGRIAGKREFDRRTRRSRHKFCKAVCYQAFYREIRSKHRCKRCGVRRYEQRLQSKTLVKGLCVECYPKEKTKAANSAALIVQVSELSKQLEQAASQSP